MVLGRGGVVVDEVAKLTLNDRPMVSPPKKARRLREHGGRESYRRPAGASSGGTIGPDAHDVNARARGPTNIVGPCCWVRSSTAGWESSNQTGG